MRRMRENRPPKSPDKSLTMSEERVALIGRRGTKGFTPVPTSFHLLNFSACVPSVCVQHCQQREKYTTKQRRDTCEHTHRDNIRHHQMQGDNIPL